MMINIDNIGSLKKCRVWLEEIPLTECKVIEVLSSTLETSNCMSRNDQRIAVELFVAPRYYAFLGVEYTYKETNRLELYVNITEDSSEILLDSLSLSSDKVHLGISNEYAQTILNASINVSKNLSNIPSGILTFNVGGHSDYGSNQIIFSKVTGILLRLLTSMRGNVEIQELKNIVRCELNKPLTDI